MGASGSDWGAMGREARSVPETDRGGCAGTGEGESPGSLSDPQNGECEPPDGETAYRRASLCRSKRILGRVGYR